MVINARRIASVLYEVLKTVTDATGHQVQFYLFVLSIFWLQSHHDKTL